MKLGPVTFEDALVVALGLRADDAAEIYATRWSDNPVELARSCVYAGEFAWVAGLDSPIAVIGAQPVWPGVWNVFMFATDEFDKIAFPLTKFVRRTIIPSLREAGAHRAECRSAMSHTKAHRWLEALGATREGVMREYGSNKEDFALYVWRR